MVLPIGRLRPNRPNTVTQVSSAPAISGKVVPMGTYCVTGAASGIGEATKRRLERDGHRVIGVDLRNAEVEADLGTDAGRRRTIDRVLELSGGVLHGLVPAAGITGVPESVVSINFFGVMALVNGFHDALARAGGAGIVFISSNSTILTPGLTRDHAAFYLGHLDDEAACRSYFADKGFLAYPAGKLALSYWARAHSVQPEWIGRGIKVNAVAPGLTDTGMTRPLLAVPEAKASVEAIPVPLGRWATPDEIASVIALLLSNDTCILGQTIIIDGGTDAVIQPTSHPNPLGG